MLSVLLLSSSAMAMVGPRPAATELTLSSAADFVGADGKLMPIGNNVEASVTTDAPFGTALRSGNAGAGHPILRPNDASASIAALLAPGVRIRNFNVMLDHFPRVPQPDTAHHAPCAVLCLVAMLVGC